MAAIAKLKPVKLKAKSVCGDGKAGHSDSRQLAQGARLHGPEALCYDHATDRLYIGEGTGCCIKTVSRDGRMRALAGSPGTKGYADGGVGVARFGWINAVAYDARTKTLYAADTVNHRIVSVDTATGITTTVAGAPAPGRSGCADGPGTTHALFCAPSGLALDTDNNRLLIADSSNHRIRALDLGTGYVSTVSGRLGKGYMDAPVIGDSQWQSPTALCFDSRSNRLFVTDALNRRVRVLNFGDGSTRTLAGSGTEGVEDGKALTVARFSVPLSIAYDRDAQRLFVGDKQLVRVIQLVKETPAAGAAGAKQSGDGAVVGNVVGTHAGLRVGGDSNAPGKDVDGNVVDKAQFGAVHGLVWDHSNGRLFVCDPVHHKIRVVLPSKHAVYLPPCARAKAFPQIPLSDQKAWDRKVEDWALRDAVDRESQLSGAYLKLLRIETKAKLQAKDVGGSSDPYFVLFLNEWPVASRRTAVTDTHLYPVLDFTRDTATTKLKEPCTLPLTREALDRLRQGTLVLHVECWDKDPIYDDFMGAGSVLLRYSGAKNSLPPTTAADAVASATAAATPNAAAAAAAGGAAAAEAKQNPWELAPRDPTVHLEEDIAIVDGLIDGGRIRVTIAVCGLDDPLPCAAKQPDRPPRAEYKQTIAGASASANPKMPVPRESTLFVRALSAFGHNRGPNDDVVVPASPARSSISVAGSTSSTSTSTNSSLSASSGSSGSSSGGSSGSASARSSGVIRAPTVASVAEDDDDDDDDVPPPPPPPVDSPKAGPATPSAAAAAAVASSSSAAGADTKQAPAASSASSAAAAPSLQRPASAAVPSGSSSSSGGAVEYDASKSVKWPEPSQPRDKKRSVVTDDKVWRTKASELRSNLGPGAVGYDDTWDGHAVLQVVRIDTLQPLLAKDLGNTSDPYFVLWLGAYGSSGKPCMGALKTPVIYKTLTPSFDLHKQPLSFPLTRRAQRDLHDGKLVLHIECWDKDPVYDDFMGWSNVLLKRAPPSAAAAAAAASAASAASASDVDVLDVMLFEKENTAGAVRMVLRHHNNGL